jgi:phosphotriesterase-related protein
VLDPRYHLALARAGVWVQFDTFIFAKRLASGLTDRLSYVETLVREGFEDRVLLSHDVCRLDHLSAFGGCGYSFLLTDVRELLDSQDWGRGLFEQFFVHNPAAALAQ